MMTILKRTALIGLGIAEHLKETLDALAEKGESNESEEAKKIRAFFASKEKTEMECRQKMADVCDRVAQSIRTPS